MQGDAVHDGAHAEFAHAVVDVVAWLARTHRYALFPVGQVRTGQVGRAAEEFRQRRRQRLDGVLAGLAGGDVFFLLDAGSDGGAQGRFECLRQLALHAAGQFSGLLREFAAVGGEALVPVRFQQGALLLRIPGCVHIGRHLERCGIPADVFAHGSDFLVAQRGAVDLVAALQVRRTLANDGLAANQSWLAGGLGGGDGGSHGGNIVTVDSADDVPAVRFEAGRGVVREPAFDFAIDGNAVVIVQGDQLVQAQGAGQRAHFVRNTFHQATVADEGVGVVVDDVVARLVEFSRQQLLRQGHADGVGDALAQRAGGRFHAWRDIDFRVARGFRMHLAEGLDVIHRQVVARQVQQRVVQHGAVAVRQQETVAVLPFWIRGIVAVVTTPQGNCDLGHAHRHAWMAGVGLLYSVHCQCADRIGHFGSRERSCHDGVGQSRVWDSFATARTRKNPGRLLYVVNYFTRLGGCKLELRRTGPPNGYTLTSFHPTYPR